MLKTNKILWMVFLLCVFSRVSFAETVIVTYVADKQEERKSTRFTLTEWLRIKERMKMMDVWLAMFSDPNKDKFSPELNVRYGISKGDLTLKHQASEHKWENVKGEQVLGQLWLTNLFTWSTGRRLLNMELGIEGDYKKSEKIMFTDSNETEHQGSFSRQAFNLGFRIFGKNIQDSSFILKIGKYSGKDSIHSFPIDDLIVSTQEEKTKLEGITAGIELQLYLLHWLGIEGSYKKFGDKSGLSVTSENSGWYGDYYAFIEIALFRFMVGQYYENWKFPVESDSRSIKETGTIGAVKLLL